METFKLLLLTTEPDWETSNLTITSRRPGACKSSTARFRCSFPSRKSWPCR